MTRIAPLSLALTCLLALAASAAAQDAPRGIAPLGLLHKSYSQGNSPGTAGLDAITEVLRSSRDPEVAVLYTTFGLRYRNLGRVVRPLIEEGRSPRVTIYLLNGPGRRSASRRPHIDLRPDLDERQFKQRIANNNAKLLAQIDESVLTPTRTFMDRMNAVATTSGQPLPAFVLVLELEDNFGADRAGFRAFRNLLERTRASMAGLTNVSDRRNPFPLLAPYGRHRIKGLPLEVHHYSAITNGTVRRGDTVIGEGSHFYYPGETANPAFVPNDNPAPTFKQLRVLTREAQKRGVGLLLWRGEWEGLDRPDASGDPDGRSYRFPRKGGPRSEALRQVMKLGGKLSLIASSGPGNSVAGSGLVNTGTGKGSNNANRGNAGDTSNGNAGNQGRANKTAKGARAKAKAARAEAKNAQAKAKSAWAKSKVAKGAKKRATKGVNAAKKKVAKVKAKKAALTAEVKATKAKAKKTKEAARAAKAAAKLAKRNKGQATKASKAAKAKKLGKAAKAKEATDAAKAAKAKSKDRAAEARAAAKAAKAAKGKGAKKAAAAKATKTQNKADKAKVKAQAARATQAKKADKAAQAKKAAKAAKAAKAKATKAAKAAQAKEAAKAAKAAEAEKAAEAAAARRAKKAAKLATVRAKAKAAQAAQAQAAKAAKAAKAKAKAKADEAAKAKAKAQAAKVKAQAAKAAKAAKKAAKKAKEAKK